MSIAQRLPDYSGRETNEQREHRTRWKYSCPDCGAGKGAYCWRYRMGSKVVTALGFKTARKQILQACHDGRHAKRILCEGV